MLRQQYQSLYEPMDEAVDEPVAQQISAKTSSPIRYSNFGEEGSWDFGAGAKYNEQGLITSTGNYFQRGDDAIVSDELLWNPHSATGQDLQKKVQAAKDAGQRTGVVVTPYAVFQDKATNQQLLDEIQKSGVDFVVLDPYFLNFPGITSDRLVEWTREFTSQLKDINKDVKLVTQGFAPKGYEQATLEHNQKLLSLPGFSEFINFGLEDAKDLQGDPNWVSLSNDYTPDQTQTSTTKPLAATEQAATGVRSDEAAVRASDWTANLPANWGSFTGEEKVQYFNQQGITPEQLAPYATPEQIQYFQDKMGYTVGKPTGEQASASSVGSEQLPSQLAESTGDYSKLAGQLKRSWEAAGYPSEIVGVSLDQRADALAKQLDALGVKDLEKLGIGSTTRYVGGDSRAQAGQLVDYSQYRGAPTKTYTYLSYDGKPIGYIPSSPNATSIEADPYDPSKVGVLDLWDPAGKGHIKFNASATGPGGLVSFEPKWDTSSDVPAEVIAAIGIALTVSGAGSALGGAITKGLGITASAATNALIGNTVMQTVMNGGDIGAALKSSLASWAGAQVGAMVGDAASSMFSNPEGLKLISNVANQATRATILGQDVESAIKNTVIAGAVDFATAKIPGFSDLPAPVKSTITQSIRAAASGESVDAGAMLANAAKEGLLSYGLSQIPQFNEADARTQSFVTTMLRSAIDGGDLSESAIKWAVGQAQQEFQKVIKAGPALDELKKAGIISEASYFGLTDEQKELVDRFAAQKDPKAAAAKYINEQTTTPEEIRQFYKQITGKDATDAEAELLSTYTGPDEATARLGLENQIRANAAADELRFEELNKVFTNPQATDQDLINVMAEYKITPAFVEKITGQKYDDIVRQMDARFMRQDEVVEAYRAAREAAGLEPRDPTPDEILRYVGSNAGVTAQIQAEVDREATTFDGSTFGSMKSAMEAAKAQGYNNFIGPDGKTHMVSSPVVAIQAGAFDGTTFGSIKSASDAAREAGKTTFVGPDEQHYMVLTPSQEGAIKDEIKQTKTFGQAFADARSRLGPGRTFEWTNPETGETKTYNTYTATELYDGSRAGSKTDAAVLAHQNGKTMFQYDGKIWNIPAGSLDNVGNQSRAEARRLVEANTTAISNEQAAALEKKLQTKKLGDLDGVVGSVANAFGLSLQGLGEQVQYFATAGALASGGNINNYYNRVGAAMVQLGEAITSRSLDQQKASAEAGMRNLAKADVKDQFLQYPKLVKDNFGWWIAENGKEVVQEFAPYAAALGVGSIAASAGASAPVVAILAAGSSAIVDGLEAFGAGAKEAYETLRKQGVPEEYARSQAIKNGLMHALVVTPVEFLADKMTLGALTSSLTGGIKAYMAKNLQATVAQTVGEYIETVGQGLATKITTLDRAMTVDDLKQINVESIFAASLGGGTTASILAGGAVIDSAVVAKDKLGNNVTLQEFLNGSRDVDLSTLNPNAVIGQGANGQPVTLGSLSAVALQDGFTPATLNESLPSSFTTDNNIVLSRDALGNEVTLGDVFSGEATPEQAKTIIQDYVDLGLTTKAPVSKVVSVDTATNTAVVQDQSGNTQTVTAGANVKTGDVVNVDPNTNTATLAGSTVVSTDTSNNTATVQNQDGTTSTVVTTDPVKVGDQVNTNQDDGTAKPADTTNAEAKGEAAAQDALVDAGLATDTTQGTVQDQAAGTDQSAVQDQTAGTGAAQTGTQDQSAATDATQDQTSGTGVTQDQAADTSKSTVVATNTDGTKAIVENSDGTSAIVDTPGGAKVGDDVVVDPTTNTAKVVDETANTGTVIATSSDGTAVVVQKADGSTAVVNTDTTATVGDKVNINPVDNTATVQAGNVTDAVVADVNVTDGTATVITSDGTKAVVDTAGQQVDPGSIVTVNKDTATITTPETSGKYGDNTTAYYMNKQWTAAEAEAMPWGQTVVDGQFYNINLSPRYIQEQADRTAQQETGVQDQTTGTVVVTNDTGTKAVVETQDGNTAVVDTSGDVKVGDSVVVDTTTNTATKADTAQNQVVNANTGIAVDTQTGVATNPNSGVTVDTNTGVATNANTNTAVDTNTGVATNANTNTAVDTNTGTAVNQNTNTAVDTNTGVTTNPNTNTAVDTNTGTAVNANTGVAVDTNTGVATNTNTNTAVDTNTGTAVNPNTNTAVDTNTGTAVNTNTGVAVDTNTGVATNTNTNTAVDTNTGVATNANTNTAVDTNTGVATNANTNTAVDTNTGVATNVNTNTAVDTNTGVTVNPNTNTAVDTNTGVATTVNPNTNTQTNVDTNTGTATTVDPNTNTQTTVDPNTNTATTVNQNTNTQTNVNTNTGVTTTVDPKTNVQTQVDPNTNTQTTVDPKTNTQTLTNTSTGAQVKTNVEEPKVVEDPRIKQLQDRIDQLIQAGLTQTAATNAAMSELTGQLSTLTQAQAAAEQARQQAAQQAAQQQSIRGALELFAPQTAGKGSNEFLPVSPLQTSGSSKFISPLAAFLATVESQNYAQPKPQQPMMPQQQPQTPDRYAYGKEPSIDELLDPYGERRAETATPFKAGGLATPLFAAGGGTRYGKYAGGGLNVVHHSGKARVDFRHGDAVTGPGDGQSDDIPAMLADGEFVFPADVVAALGNGSTKAGSDKLYDMMHSIRAHARSSGPKDLPPPAKSPLEYLKGAKQKSARRTT